MKYLGVDYGTKNIGIAVSTDDGRMAFPKETIPNNTMMMQYIKTVCDEENIDEIVVGESLDYKNNPNPVMADIERFVQSLRDELGKTVHLEPEFMTSQQAEKIQGKHDNLDASAAAIILQSYLDKVNNGII